MCLIVSGTGSLGLYWIKGFVVIVDCFVAVAVADLLEYDNVPSLYMHN